MTVYLQRLLDRAAGIAAVPASPGLSPAITSGSPILRFDQRLGDPALAGDYAISGASPPEPDHGEDGPPAAMPAPIPRSQEMAAPPRPEMPDAAAARPAIGETPAPAREAMRPPAVAVPADSIERPHSRPSQPAADSRPRRKAEPEGNPSTAARPPAPELRPDSTRLRDSAIESEASIRRLRDEIRTEAAVPPSPREPVVPIRVPATPPAAAPAAAPSPRGEPAAAAMSPDRPAVPPMPAAELAPQPAVAPRPEPIRPVAIEPPPLESPAPGPSAREIARLVEEAVRKAMPGAESRPAGAAEVDQTKPAPKPEAAKRPATAADASVIGKLERSGFSPMLFGVRRR